MRICDECNYGSYQGRCVICGGPGVSDAYYCKECTIQEKDVSVLKRTWFLFLFRDGNVKCSSPLCLTARWLSEDCQFGQLQNRSVLWKEEVRLQEEVKSLWSSPCFSVPADADFFFFSFFLKPQEIFFWLVNKALFYIFVFMSLFWKIKCKKYQWTVVHINSN